MVIKKMKRKNQKNDFSLAAVVRWVRFQVDNPILAAWKIVFAMVAIVDMSTCWTILLQGWNIHEEHHPPQHPHPHHQGGGNAAAHQKMCFNTSAEASAAHGGGLKFPFNNNHNKNQATCSAVEPPSSLWSLFSSFPGGPHHGGFFFFWRRFITTNNTVIYKYIGPLFGLLCLVEAAIRAREARMLAIENQLLDNFEKSLERVYSSTRMSFRRRFTSSPKLLQGGGSHVHGVGNDKQSDTTLEKFLARSTLRTWIPTMTVICFWLALVPMPTTSTMSPSSLAKFSSLYTCGNDTALATIWITNTLTQYALVTKLVQEFILSQLLSWALPYKLYQPVRFYHRLRQLLRWIRYARFAFPLCRMLLKLLDQVSALTKTWRQSIVAHTEKAKRIARRSMIFEDIRKIESLAKVQTALAALPSQLFHLSSVGGGGGGIGDAKLAQGLQRQQKQGRSLQRQLQQLKRDVDNDGGDDTSNSIDTSDLYDRVVHLTQQLKVVMNNTLLSSHHLISPHSRFSVVWRIMVTNCLLLELFRLSVSWHLSETFKISLTQIISRLLVDCQDEKGDADILTKHLAFITDRVHDIHKRLFEAIPILLPPPEDLISSMICVPSSASAKLFLQLGGILEDFVDVVSFADIFIWFFTGDLDVTTGIIIPKPFFTRCILPGTLVQVLDHPTLPETLPTLIAQAMNAARAVGWSRAIRWILAIGPAFIMLVVNPFKFYFFRHMDHIDQDIIMRYAESCGMLTPARPSFYSGGGWATSTSVSGANSGDDLCNIVGDNDDRDSYHHPTTTSTSTSQVGLSLFDSPPLAGRTIVRTPGGGNEDSIMPAPTMEVRMTNSYIPPIPLPPPILAPILRNNNRSIHFDPAIIGRDDDEDDDHDDDHNDGDDEDSYQFSYSARSLNMDD